MELSTEINNETAETSLVPDEFAAYGFNQVHLMDIEQEYDLPASQQSLDSEASQQIRENPRKLAFIQILARVKTKEFKLDEFIRRVTPYQEHWFTCNPEYNYFNIFHYLAYFKITDEREAESLRKFLGNLIAMLKESGKIALLYSKKDQNATSAYSDMEEPPITPLQHAVLKGAYYYGRLLITQLLEFTSLLSNADNFKAAITLDAKFMATSQDRKAFGEIYSKNRRYIYYFIIDELLIRAKNLNKNGIDYSFIAEIVTTAINNEQVAVTVNNLSHAYHDGEYLPLLHQIIRRTHVKEMNLLIQIFHKISKDKLAKYDQPIPESSSVAVRRDPSFSDAEPPTKDGAKDLGLHGDNLILYSAFYISWGDKDAKDFFKFLLESIKYSVRELQNHVSGENILHKLFINPRLAAEGILTALITHYPIEDLKPLFNLNKNQVSCLALPFANKRSYSLNYSKKNKSTHILRMIDHILEVYPGICERQIEPGYNLIDMTLYRGFEGSTFDSIYQDLLIKVIAHSDISEFTLSLARDKEIDLDFYLECATSEKVITRYVEFEEHDKLKRELQKIQRELKDFKKQFEDSEDYKKRLSEENKKLEDDLKAEQASARKRRGERFEEDSKRLKRLEEEKQEQKQQITEMKRMDEEIQSLRKKEQELEKQYKQQIEQLNKRVEDLQEQLSSEKQQYFSNINELNQQMASLLEQKDSVKKEKQELAVLNQQLKQEIDESKALLANTELKLQEAKNALTEFDKLKSDYKKAQLRAEKLEKEYKELTGKLHTQIQENSKTRKEFDEINKKWKKNQDELDAANDKVQFLEGEIERLKEGIHNLSNNIEIQQDAYERQMEELQMALDREEEKNKVLSAKNSGLSQELSSLKKKNRALQQRIDFQDQQLKELTQDEDNQCRSPISSSADIYKALGYQYVEQAQENNQVSKKDKAEWENQQSYSQELLEESEEQFIVEEEMSGDEQSEEEVYLKKK